MSYITKSMTIIITLSVSCAKPQVALNDYYHPHVNSLTREIHLKKQGVIQGMVVQLRDRDLPPVEVYRGIPYAAPPVDSFRFMPPSSTLHTWKGTKYATEFGPVCPQKFPDESKMTEDTRKYFRRLKQFLKNESEDCLYLNIYAPNQDSETHSRAFPVIVFLHGESFEWNSGNPYDGSVLAAFGQVIVVTLNFRLGILGFLKVEAEESTNQSNFGLVDQVAALLWIEANIDAFGGDPTKVTLMGHGTGAVCASLLTISPMAVYENKNLFHRAILMSGTALADWALVNKPLDISIQVADALNCQLHDNFAACLRRKRLEEIMSVTPVTESYRTIFGPVVDSLLVPNDPKKSMTQYTDIFKRFELMYGVTEMESIYLPLGDLAITHGMMESQRDDELRIYMRTRCEMKPEACFAQTRAKYNYEDQRFQKDQTGYKYYMGYEPDKASLARDELLDILSDARTVAPLLQTGLYHSALNLQSYFYVFGHKTRTKEYIRNKTQNGEELPYVFGVPIEGPKFHFQDATYSEEEKKFSKTLMRYFCNFAYTGNPNVPRMGFPETEYLQWHQFDKEWYQFEETQQNYLHLGIPITNEQFYRKDKMDYWNNDFPNITLQLQKKNKNPLPWVDPFHKIRVENKYENFNKTENFPSDNGIIKLFGNRERQNIYRNNNVYGKVLTSPPEEVKQSTSTLSVLLLVGAIFLLVNLIFFAVLYYKCIKKKKTTPNPLVIPSNTEEITIDETNEKEEKSLLLSSCNIVKMLSKSSKGEDVYDAVQVENKTASKPKLTRAMSNSTIDAHAKVRDWIANEIVLKYSPKVDRKPKKGKDKKNKEKEKIILELPIEIDSTLDKSPTRPVSPTNGVENIAKPLLIKTASIDRSNHRRINKVSVAIDATPSGRGPSVLAQQPIELTKSFDYPKVSPNQLRRSITLEDFSPRTLGHQSSELRKSISNIDLKSIDTEPIIIRIDHSHSKSDPVQEVDYNVIKKLKTFDPNCDINVTSRDENMEVPPPLTSEEALMTIKRRNFPKVLPDHPGRHAFLSKRRSMPVHNLYVPMTDSQYSNSEPYSPTGRNFMRFPPVPPPRTTTLGRQGSNPQPVCLSEPMLAEEPPASPEPEVTCNNLYVGPIIPKNKTDISQEILNIKEEEKPKNVKVETRAIPRAIISANPNTPIKRIDPKVVVKPIINRNKCDERCGGKHIPRVVVPDNRPEVIYSKPKTASKDNLKEKEKSAKQIVEKENQAEMNDPETEKQVKSKKSQIPTLIKGSNTSLNKGSSSSESNTPSSEDSDTGTVVKRG